MQTNIPEADANDLRGITTGRQQMWANGFRPVSLVAAQDASFGGKRPIAADWQLGARLDPPHATTHTASVFAPNTGVLCDGLRAVDIDISDQMMARTVRTLAERMLGATPGVRFRRNSSKLALLYRAAEGEPGKATVTGPLHDPKAGISQLVEVLGCGQQLVVDGWHASGVHIEWEGSRPMDGLTLDMLPALTEEQVGLFLSAVAQLISGKVGTGGRGSGDKFDTRESAPVWSPGKALDALRAIPNTEQAVPTWAAFLAILGGFRRVLGSEAQAHEAEARAWATQHGWCSDEDFTRIWKTVADTYTSPDTLALHAEQHGWTEPHDFPTYAPVEPAEPQQALAVRPTFFSLQRAAARPKRDWVYGNLILAGQVTVVAGIGGVGKSSLALAIAAAIITGRDLLGEPVHAIGKVWVFDEDPLDELDRRMLAVQMLHNVDPAALESGLMLDSLRTVLTNQGGMRGLMIAQAEKDRVTLTPVRDAMIEAIKAHGVRVLIVNPFSKTHDCDENKNGHMRTVMDEWIAVAEATGCAIVLVHHNRKGASAGTEDGDDARGASAIRDCARITKALYRMTRDEAKKLGIDEDERRRLVQLQSGGKNNVALPSAKATWFRLASVTLPSSESVGAVERFKLPEPDVLDIEAQHAILKAIEGAPEDDPYRSDIRSAGRWVGSLLVDAGLGEDAAKQMVKLWFASGIIEKVTFTDSKHHVRQTGVRTTAPVGELGRK